MENASRSMSRRRLWAFRIIVTCTPFVAVLLIEGLLRLCGIGGPPPVDLRVEFEAGTTFFPEWDAEIAMPKSQQRIFVLGGSSAMGFGVETGLSELLAQELNAEVINGGVVAYGSHRVLEVLRRALLFEPDAIVLFFGHNEFLEDVFYDPEGVVAKAEGIGRFSRRLHVVNAVRGMLGDTIQAPRPKLQRHFVANTQFPLIESAAEHALRVQMLEANLRQMIAACREAGVPLVVAPAPANLLSPPGDYAQHTPEWQARIDRARENLDAGKWELAAAVLADAHKLNAEEAVSHYLLGLAELGRGDAEAAEQALVRANALDTRGDRNNSQLTTTILELCGAEDVAVVDLRETFYAELIAEFARMRGGAPGRLFLDHCHPSEAGHRMIAEAVLPQLQGQLK